MLAKLRHKEVKVRRPNSQKYEGEDKFTGTVTYQLDGTLDRERVRLSLGTEEKSAAVRRVAKLERAVAEGPMSPLWPELNEALPPNTFKFFADRIGYIGQTNVATSQITWQTSSTPMKLRCSGGSTTKSAARIAKRV